MGNKEVKILIKSIVCDIVLEIAFALISHAMRKHIKENEFRESTVEREDYR